MSYYIKDANNVVHSAGPNGVYNPFTAIQTESHGDLSIYSFSKPQYTPFIIIKDGNYPTYDFEEIRYDGGRIKPNKRYKIEYPWIGHASFSSKNEEYSFSWDGSNPTLDYTYKCRNLGIKEIYFGDKPFITYSNEPSYVSKFLTDKSQGCDYFSAYNADKNYELDINNTNNFIGPVIRGTSDFQGTGPIKNGSKFINVFSDIDTDINYNTPGNVPVNNYLKIIRTSSTNIRQGLSPLTSVYERDNVYSNPITYNVFDVSYYNAVQVKYLYNILMAGEITDITAGPEGGTVKIADDTPINNFNLYCPKDDHQITHPFVFNYFTANDYSENWPNRTNNTFISNPNVSNYNLKSSIEYNADTDGYEIKDIDYHKFYNLSLLSNTPDIWNNEETNKRLFFTKVNTEHSYGEGTNLYEKYHVITCNGKYDYYLTKIRFDLDEIATQYSMNTKYNLGDIVYAELNSERFYYIANQYVINVGKDPKRYSSKSDRYAEHPEDAEWIDVYIVGYNDRADIPNPNSAGADIYYDFPTGFYDNYLQNPKFIPYIKTDSKYCYFDNDNYDQSWYNYHVSSLSSYINTYEGAISNSVWNKYEDEIDTFDYDARYNANQQGVLFWHDYVSYAGIKHDYVGNQEEVRTKNQYYYLTTNSAIQLSYVSGNHKYRFTSVTTNTDNSRVHLIPVNSIYMIPQAAYIVNHPKDRYIRMLGNSKYVRQFKCNYYKTYDTTIQDDIFCYCDGTPAANTRVKMYVHGFTQDIGTCDEVFDENSTAPLWTDIKFPLSASATSFDRSKSYTTSTSAWGNGTNYYMFKEFPYSGYSANVSYTDIFSYPVNNSHKFYYYVTAGDQDPELYPAYYLCETILTGNTVNFFSNECFNDIKYIQYWNVNYGTYEKNDLVKLEIGGGVDEYYYATVKHESNMENHPSAINNIWNTGGYSMNNSRMWKFNGYNIINCIGSATLTIDTNDVNYLYLANPSTTLLDCDETSGKFKNSQNHIFISDLAVHVEPLP